MVFPKPTLPVLIVGAGPTGLVTALMLALNGIKIRIIDRDDTFHIGSRGAGIQPRTFELFRILGIIDDVEKYATATPTMRSYKLPGGTEVIKTWDLYEKNEPWLDRPYANGACLDQCLLENILRKHLAKYGVIVELRKNLVAISQDADNLTATVTSSAPGSTETRETIIAQYLVGADGARGSCRKLLGLTFEGETRDADGIVSGEAEIKNLSNNYWHMWGKPGHFTILARPLNPTTNKFSIAITGHNFDLAHLVNPVDVVQFIHAETGRTDLQFGQFSWLSYFRPNMRMVNKFQEGRAFVVGDSAHVHSPTGGQGMNSSVQDASNLAWKLALVLKGIATPRLLASYNDERLPVIAQMLHTTSALYTHIVINEKLIETAKKEVEEEKTSGWFRWRNSALQMYGVNYRYSNIVLEERDSKSQDMDQALAHAFSGYEGLGELRAGDRAPEAPGLVSSSGQETSLLDLFQPTAHTILFFTADGREQFIAELIASTARYSKDAIRTILISPKESGTVEGLTQLVDRDGHAHNAYLVEKDKMNIVIVRPDGFIGAILVDATGVQRYFANILDHDA